jgi:hypothetical protein
VMLLLLLHLYCSGPNVLQNSLSAHHLLPLFLHCSSILCLYVFEVVFTPRP